MIDYRQTTRRFLATLAFRTRHALQDAPLGFEDFEAGMEVRTPLQILHHMTHCLDWVIHILKDEKPTQLERASWMEAVEMFHSKLNQLDQALIDNELADDDKCYRMLQGPLCDAMTHVGQLMMIRRLMGSSVKGTNYYKADIKNGEIGPRQPLPQK
jgi:hypothetical protein